jgi:hypothetical protein
MTERERALQNLCRRLQEDNWELREANANLRVERDAGDALLGEALDERLTDAGRIRSR